MSAPFVDRIGVVIPTQGRPQLVLRAVRSVLGQTYTNLELIVVLDGPDDETELSLAGIGDSRLRVEVIAKSGAAAARNAGVCRLVDAEWVAFLDDDDLWYPSKLKVQLTLAKKANVQLPVVACRTLKVGNHGAVHYPSRLPLLTEPISEFLFVPRGWRARRGGVQTSTFLVPRILLKHVAFDESLPRHQDWDWLLRVAGMPGVELIVASEILAEWDHHAASQRISDSYDWRYSFKWIRARRELVTSRAYAAFLLTVVPVSAARGNAGMADFLLLLKESLRGRPGFLSLAIFFVWWLIPDRLIKWMGRVSDRLK